MTKVVSNDTDISDIIQAHKQIAASSIKFKPLTKWLEMQPRRWLVRDWIRCGQTLVLYGPTMTMKSFVALDFALSVANHQPFAEQFPTRPGKVAYVYSEAPEGGPQRVNAWLHTKKVKPNDNFIVTTARLALIDNGVDELANSITGAFGQNPDFVVIDTLSKNFGSGDENGSDMQRFTGAIEDLRQKTGAAILVVHHTGKDENKQERGHSSLRADLDGSIKVVRNKDANTVFLENQKMKDTADGKGIYLRPKRIVLGHIEDEYTGTEEISSIALSPIDPGEAQEIRAKAEEAKATKQTRTLLTPLLDGPLGARQWRDRCPVKNTTFGELKATALSRKWIDKGEGRNDPYTLTDQGREYLQKMEIISNG